MVSLVHNSVVGPIMPVGFGTVITSSLTAGHEGARRMHVGPHASVPASISPTCL